MGRARDREEFVYLLTKEGADLESIRKIMRLGKHHRTLMEHACNFGLDERGEARVAQIRRELMDLVEKLDWPEHPVFSGDPRGPTVLIRVPSRRTNDWGQRGLCVP